MSDTKAAAPQKSKAATAAPKPVQVTIGTKTAEVLSTEQAAIKETTTQVVAVIATTTETATTVAIEEKKCRLCNEVKPRNKFAPTEWRKGARCRQCRKFDDLLRKYGLKRKDFYDMLEAQENKCGICPGELTAKTAQVDHWHTGTKKVRGLLCVKCNTGLGKLGDDVEPILRSVNYLCKALDQLSTDQRAAITLLLTTTSESLAKVPQNSVN